MPYVPFIADYKPFYIQTGNDATALDTASTWGMVAKVNPYPALPSPKATYSNDWFDEDGGDEWVEDLYYESYTFDVDFYITTFDSSGSSASEIMNNQLAIFFAKVREGEFKVYDSYTAIGRQEVRFVSHKKEQFVSRDDWARAIVRVTFKVGDPVTLMYFSDGSIVSARDYFYTRSNEYFETSASEKLVVIDSD